MSDKPKDCAKELEETKQRVSDPKIKQVIEEKQPYVNRPIKK